MPIRKASSDNEKKEKIIIFSVALDKTQRNELKQILKERETINKEAIMPIRINDNLQIKVNFIEDPSFFQYQNVLRVRNIDKFLKSEYDNLYFDEMQKTGKNVNLTQIEQILLDTWNEMDQYIEMLEELYKEIPSVDAEIKKRMRIQFENQVRLEKFLLTCIEDKDQREKFLTVIKDLSMRETEDFIDSISKGETVKVW